MGDGLWRLLCSEEGVGRIMRCLQGIWFVDVRETSTGCWHLEMWLHVCASQQRSTWALWDGDAMG